MTRQQEAMVAFLRGRYTEGIRMAKDIARMLTVQGAEVEWG
ncbi:hypothetical protein ACFY1L_55955 [Streptomyces sp. NPDC001663]